MADQMYRCTQCSHQTVFRFQLERHVKKEHRTMYAAKAVRVIVKKPSPFSCVRCDFESLYKLGLYEHHKHNTKSAGKYSCELCKYKSHSSLYFAKHYNSCDALPITLDSGTRKNRSLRRRTVQNDFQFQCSECSYGAKRKYDMKIHMFQHAGTEEINWIECTECSYKTKRKSHLNVHMLKHASIEKTVWFECSQCLYRSKYKNSFKRHAASQHAGTNQDITWWQCTQCSYKSKQKDNLRRHMLKHADEIDWFYCQQCSYRTKYKSHLKSHAVRHDASKLDSFKSKTNNQENAAAAAAEGVNLFKCTECVYRTKERGNLKKHMLKHASSEEIDWFVCEKCAAMFKRHGDLRMHMMQHATTDEISWFSCTQCSYKGKQKIHLKTHMLKHAADEEIRWFNCEMCSFRAKQKSNLKAHMLKHVMNP